MAALIRAVPALQTLRKGASVLPLLLSLAKDSIKLCSTDFVIHVCIICLNILLMKIKLINTYAIRSAKKYSCSQLCHRIDTASFVNSAVVLLLMFVNLVLNVPSPPLKFQAL